MQKEEINFEKIKFWLEQCKTIPDSVKKRKLENEIIIEAIPLVKKISSHLARRSNDPTEDILQVGILGLIKCLILPLAITSKLMLLILLLVKSDITCEIRLL